MCAVGDLGGAVTGRIYDLYARGLDLGGKREALQRPAHERSTLDAAEILAHSPARRLLLGMKAGDRLVYGHTHRPSVSDDGLTANPGGWVEDGGESGTYLRIEDDQVDSAPLRARSVSVKEGKFGPRWPGRPAWT